MKQLPAQIHDPKSGLDYVLVGDYYYPVMASSAVQNARPIGRWGRLHRTYLKEYRPVLYNQLVLNGSLHIYLARLDEQATSQCRLIIQQLQQAEGVTEGLKAANQLEWVRRMNSIRNRAEEIVLHEMIYNEPQEGVQRYDP
jgi:hypothetical protein